MHKYKNISKNEQTVDGVGPVKAGAEFSTERVIENPNFDYVGPGDSSTEVAETVVTPVEDTNTDDTNTKEGIE